MDPASLSKRQLAGLQPIPADRVSQSLKLVMGWQEAELPSRFAIGSGDLRKLTLRVREQPVNFMVTIHRSLTTAGDGQGVCRRGLKASTVLLGEESHYTSSQKEFTTTTIEEIRKSASDLNDRTKDIYTNFRLLRTVVIGTYQELKETNDRRGRADFFVRLARYLSKDIMICEDGLRKVQDDLEEIEKSLDLVIQWWQIVQTEVNHLQMSGKSGLMLEENTILLNKIKESFVTLDRYFGDYLDKITKIYDTNVPFLNPNNWGYLNEVRDCTDFMVSNGGRLEPRRK